MSSTSTILGVIAAAVLAGALAACGTPSTSAHPVAAGLGGAAEVPVRVQPNAVGWSGMVQRPDHIYVGMGGAPIARQLAWRNWGGPPGMGGRQAGHLLAAARPGLRLAPGHLHGHGAPAGHRDAQRPAVVPEDGGLLRQPPRCRKGAALHVPHSAGRISPGVESWLGQERPKINQGEPGKREI